MFHVVEGFSLGRLVKAECVYEWGCFSVCFESNASPSPGEQGHYGWSYWLFSLSIAESSMLMSSISVGGRARSKCSGTDLPTAGFPLQPGLALSTEPNHSLWQKLKFLSALVSFFFALVHTVFFVLSLSSYTVADAVYKVWIDLCGTV